MADGNSVINFGDLSKPAIVLIEKVSSAVGLIYESFHIKRMARAEAEAEKIRAVAKIELDDLQHRALERFVQQEARNQENIEQITAQAASTLPQDAKVEELDEDWVAHFFKQCDTVSDKEMQSLWARLLSGEATTPGTFSKRTVNFVSSMSKQDAALFTTLCQFLWVLSDPVPLSDDVGNEGVANCRFSGVLSVPVPLIYDLGNEVFAKQGINFSTLTHLDKIGLISFASNGYYRGGLKKYIQLSYHAQPTQIELPADENNTLEVGRVLLTAIGEELAPICGSNRNEHFYEYVVNKWFAESLIPSSVLPEVMKT